jgi:hypothetical protein
MRNTDTSRGRIIIADDNWQTVYELTFENTNFQRPILVAQSARPWRPKD